MLHFMSIFGEHEKCIKTNANRPTLQKNEKYLTLLKIRTKVTLIKCLTPPGESFFSIQWLMRIHCTTCDTLRCCGSLYRCQPFWMFAWGPELLNTLFSVKIPNYCFSFQQKRWCYCLRLIKHVTESTKYINRLSLIHNVIQRKKKTHTHKTTAT